MESTKKVLFLNNIRFCNYLYSETGVKHSYCDMRPQSTTNLCVSAVLLFTFATREQVSLGPASLGHLMFSDGFFRQVFPHLLELITSHLLRQKWQYQRVTDTSDSYSIPRKLSCSHSLTIISNKSETRARDMVQRLRALGTYRGPEFNF